MITDEQIALVIKMANKHIAEGKEPDFAVIRNTIRVKFFTDYHVSMLERIYKLEKDNPMFKPKKLDIKEDYVDVNI